MNHNIKNLTAAVTDYPKLWEWDAVFISLHQSIRDIIDNDRTLRVLLEGTKLPEKIVSNMQATYKGAKINFGGRLKLDGELSLKFKEIKGATPANSWLVRRAMKTWCFLVDDFFGQKAASVADYKSILHLSMLDETGKSFYQVKFFGVKPTNLAELSITQNVSEEYPPCEVSLTYDFWRDQYDPEFGSAG